MPAEFWHWVRQTTALLFYFSEPLTVGLEHYITLLHCINAIIMIISVIHSPPRETHYPDLPPIAYIFLIKRWVHFSLFYIYISHFKFSAPSHAGQAGEASRPKFTTYKLHITFPEEGLKTGGGVELAGLPAPPTSHNLHLYPFHPSPTFPVPNYTAGNLEIPLTSRKPVSNPRK